MNVNDRAAIRVAALYALLSSLYILFSDQIVLLMFDDPGLITSVQSIKGWGFVAASAVLIYVLIVRELKKIKHAENELSAHNSFLENLLENSPAVMHLKDTEGKYLRMNRRFRELVRSETEDPVGKTDLDLFPVAAAKTYQKHDREVMASDSMRSFTEEHPHIDGSTQTYISIKFPVRDANGELVGVFSISTDVTDQVQLEERLKRTERLNALGRLTGGIAHDFNNHLTVIIGCFQMLQASDLDHGERVNLAREGSRASFQAASLIDRLLSFARKQNMVTQQVEVNRAIRDMGGLLNRSLGRGVTLTYSLQRTPLFALLDPAQLESAVLNLCINARDAMPNGGDLHLATRRESIDAVTAAAEEISPGDYVQIDVQDSGEGMAQEILTKVREPFFTTKDPGKGTGLGLSMVDGFARQSNGCLRIASKLGQGTTVSILLPLLEPEIQTPTDDVHASPAARLGNGEKILVVEDEPAVREYSSRMLEQNGFIVLTAMDGVEAIAHMEKHDDIALLFSDIMLPGDTLGVALAERFMERFPDRRVLLASGYEELGNWPTTAPGPQPHVLKKPFGKDALLGAIAKALWD